MVGNNTAIISQNDIAYCTRPPIPVLNLNAYLFYKQNCIILLCLVETYMLCNYDVFMRITD